MMIHPEERIVCYGENAIFVPKCPTCGQYVKAYRRVKFDYEGQPKGPNGTCKTHGRIQMLWQGYY